MANGHVEIHDPISNHSNLASPVTPTSTSDTSSSMEGTQEFRILMAYAKRRRPKKHPESPPRGVNGPPSSPQTPEETGKEPKKRKKRLGGKRLLRLIGCIKPAIEEKEPMNTPVNRCFPNDGVREEGEVEVVVSRLTALADEIPFTPPEIEEDCSDGEVEKVVGLLLRQTGDRLNEQHLKDANIAAELFLNYGFFENLIKALLRRMGLMSPEPNALGPQASPKTQIAVTCEATSRLSAVDTLPMSSMLDHGARYLQDHYSSWVQQHGGYEGAFYSDEEEEEEEDSQ